MRSPTNDPEDAAQENSGVETWRCAHSDKFPHVPPLPLAQLQPRSRKTTVRRIPCSDNAVLMRAQQASGFWGASAPLRQRSLKNHMKSHRTGLQSQAQCCYEHLQLFTGMTHPLSRRHRAHKHVIPMLRQGCAGTRARGTQTHPDQMTRTLAMQCTASHYARAGMAWSCGDTERCLHTPTRRHWSLTACGRLPLNHRLPHAARVRTVLGALHENRGTAVPAPIPVCPCKALNATAIVTWLRGSLGIRKAVTAE